MSSKWFTNMCLKFYGLGTCHYFSRTGLIWDAMLKMTGFKLDLITDFDMYQFTGKSMRPRTCYITQIYSKANNS